MNPVEEVSGFWFRVMRFPSPDSSAKEQPETQNSSTRNFSEPAPSEQIAQRLADLKATKGRHCEGAWYCDLEIEALLAEVKNLRAELALLRAAVQELMGRRVWISAGYVFNVSAGAWERLKKTLKGSES